jgi:disease resistance protein RPS2
MRDAIQEARDLSAQSEQNQKRMHWVFYKLSISGQITELNAKFDRIFRELKEDFSIFEKAQQIVSTPPPPEVFFQPVPDGGFVGSGFESAETQLQTWITAEAPQVRRFGVYGMAGVGKTSLLKSVYNFSKVSHVFDVVIWLTVSRAYKISDLQNSVGRAINLNFSITDDNDTEKMALFANLKNKKFLLVLDDIWTALDLEELGVGFGTHKGSKVVFSTRDRDIALTEADESREVKPLSSEEGWHLFERVAFKGSHVQDEIMKCAKKIAEQCKCLPLAITVVAKATRGKKTAGEWNTSLSNVKITDPSCPYAHPNVDKELYQKLRWSYDDLAQTPYLQNCFLYCAMYPEDEKIWVDELVRMWIAEGFVKSKEETYSEDMQLGHRYVKLLIDRGLFQSVNFENQSMGITGNKPVKPWKKRFITAHDVIRDMAIHIGEKEGNYLCRAGLQRKDFPRSQTQVCKRMSLRLNQVESLPDASLCTELVSLILSKNPLAYDVRGSFLINLTSLRVLDLSNTQIEWVPTSLTHLRVLDLSNTQIQSVPTSLTRLQFLTLRCTCIKELPRDIGNLSNLHFLDISECKYLTSLPTEISQLTSLKRLHLNMGMENAVKDPSNVMALMGLKNLMEFQLFMFFKFETHEIMGTIMGSWVEMRHLYLHHNHMSYVKCNLPEGMQNMKKLQSFVLFDYRGTILPNWICEFQQLQRLELDCCENVKELPPLERLPYLKFLKLRKYSNVRDLGIGSFGKRSGFPKLEMLHLSEMPKLRSIGVLVEETLPNLHVLKIKKCPLLRKLPMGLEKLPNLRALYGYKISWWEKIIWEDHNIKIRLHKLFKEI